MGPHYGLRIKFKTNIKSMTVPEMVRPRPLEELVKEPEKLGLAEPNEEDPPNISWAEARGFTRKNSRNSDEEEAA